jgi:periplasmic protein CpxP/Spy
MKPKWLMLIALFALVAAGGTVLIAQGGSGGWSGHHWAARMGRGPGMAFGPFGHSLRFMTRYLNLTEDQQTQIRQILQQEREANATERQQRAEQLQAIQEQIHQATLDQTFDESNLRQLYQQRSALLEDGFLARQKTMHQIYALLTPDQQQKVQDLFAMRQAWGGARGPAGR